MSEKKVTVFIADDHAVVRSGLRMLLEAEEGLEVVGEAGDAAETLQKVRAKRPDILLLDLTMPGPSPIESIPSLLATHEGLGIVVLTMQSDPAYARAALSAGAGGYVLKEAADSDLVDAIRQVASGSTYLHPTLGAKLAQEEPEQKAAGPPDDLSEREAEVLGLVALGHTNQEIAEKLFLSVRTVESHRAHIQQKLRMNSRAELVRYALDKGLVEL